MLWKQTGLNSSRGTYFLCELGKVIEPFESSGSSENGHSIDQVSHEM